MRTRQNAAEPTEEAALTAEEQAALDAQRNAPEPKALAQELTETPQEGAGEAEPGEGVEQAAADKRPQMVPHAALHEERERRKETERKLAEVERRAEERFKVLLEKLGPQTPPAQVETPAIPDVQADPVGHIVGTMRQLGASQEQINQEVAAQRQRAQEAQLVSYVRTQASAHEREFRRDTPDYNDAVDYLKGIYDAQLAANGITDPGQRELMVQQEAIKISAMAIQQGANIAERFYNLAKATGYRPQQAQQAEQTPDPAAQIQRIARGQEQARSLGNTRGNGPTPMTAQKLLEMSDAEFDKIKDSPQVRSLMGA